MSRKNTIARLHPQHICVDQPQRDDFGSGFTVSMGKYIGGGQAAHYVPTQVFSKLSLNITSKLPFKQWMIVCQQACLFMCFGFMVSTCFLYCHSHSIKVISMVARRIDRGHEPFHISFVIARAIVCQGLSPADRARLTSHSCFTAYRHERHSLALSGSLSQQ